MENTHRKTLKEGREKKSDWKRIFVYILNLYNHFPFRSSCINAHLLFVERAALGQQGLSLGGFASEGAESLDAEGLAGLSAGDGPLVLLSPGVRLLGHHLSVLVAHQVRLLQAGIGFFLGSTEDRGFCAFAPGAH